MQEMHSLAVKSRTHLSKINQIEESLFDMFRFKKVSKSDKERISDLFDLLQFCERDESEIELFNTIIEEAMANHELSSKDIVKLYNILQECKDELKSFVDEAFREEIARSFVSDEEYSRYFDFLKNYVREGVARDKEMKKKETKEIIYRYPGHYIKSLYNHLRKKFGIDGLAYSTVLNYVNELADEDAIITIGGPQGKFRYCFPNPQNIRDRSNYYDGPFGIVGQVSRKVTKNFKSLGRGGFYNFYVVNSLIRETLLVVDFAVPIPYDSQIFLKSYGNLEPFKYLEETMGYVPTNGIKEMDVLFAWKVAKVEDGKEKEIWSEPSKALLKVPTLWSE